MTLRRRFLFPITLAVALIAALALAPKVYWFFQRSTADLTEVRARVLPELDAELAERGLVRGAATFIRIFKEERVLEVWMQSGTDYTLFRSYPICDFSGDFGPKLREGDRQSPEGFYSVDLAALNPNSSYHLAFNIGFPNAFDQANGRTGSFLMVHGNCASVGCYAMTDAGIEEIYLMVEAALLAGQSTVQVHAFPFRMTDERLQAEEDNLWHEYWLNLKTGYDLFEADRRPPSVSLEDAKYRFSQG